MSSVIHGTILETELKDFDLIITDPPIANLKNDINTSDIKNLSFESDMGRYLIEFKKYLHKMANVLSESGKIVIGHLGRSSSNYDGYEESIAYLKSLNFYLNEMVLIRLKNKNDIKIWYVFSKNMSSNINIINIMHADKRIKKVPSQFFHLGVNDENNIKFIIDRYSNTGDKVLDPFGGSGTIACVAKAMDRIGYSFDIDIDAHNFAKTMIDSDEYIQEIKMLPIKHFYMTSLPAEDVLGIENLSRL
jgi:DNA modification methylase